MDANEALDQLKKAVAQTASAAREQEARGAHPDALALGTTAIMDGMSEEAKLAHLGAVAAKLPDGARAQALSEMIEQLPAEQQRAAVEAVVEQMSDEEFEQFVARRQAKRKPTPEPGNSD
jgi:DNA-directed RNA polymerase specialized sigma24 family protein